MTLKYTFKMVKMANILYVLYQVKKINLKITDYKNTYYRRFRI